jgi:hypothetical protein
MVRLALIASLFLSLSPRALSCFCVPSGGCPGLGGEAFPVFLGTVLSVTDLPRTADDAFLSSRKARIQVDESFGGLSPEMHEVDVLTGSGGGDCGVTFRPGEKYLVEASIESDGLVHAGICGITRRIDDASVDLQLLRQLRSGQQAPSLVGQIAQHERNFDGPLGMHAPRPLPNVPVRVKAEGKVYEARADVAGLFEFYNLPPEKYEFAPELPPGTTLSWFIGSDGPQVPFELSAGACLERDIEIFASGSIQGRVLDSSNKPLLQRLAYIVPADEKVLPKEHQLYWEGQDTEGFFKFVHIPPGEYLIVVNPDDSQNPDFPYQRTFYPGVHDRASAKIITVREGEQIKSADIRLQEQFTPRHLTVRVVWSDGRLIRDFVYVQAKGTDNAGAMSDANQPDLKASILDLSVLPNEPYEVEAELTCRYADERSEGPGARLQSNKIYLEPKDQRTEVILTMPTTACPEISGKTLVTDQ